MPLNPDFVGRVYPPGESYLVGREKVREFAAAIGESAAIHHDPAAARARGYADVVAPPTFAFVLAMRSSQAVVDDPELGLDYTRVVHGEQRFAYSRPIVAGDELVVTTAIEAIRSAAGNDLVTTRAEVANTAGELVVTAHTLLVSRGTDGDA
jgi:acyl dehydratase